MPRGTDLRVRNPGRKGRQQRVLAEQPGPITSPAHAKHEAVRHPRVVRPALDQDGTLELQRDHPADNVKARGRIIHNRLTV